MLPVNSDSQYLNEPRHLCILCGILISSALFISELLITEHENIIENSKTINESTLFDYYNAEDLMALTGTICIQRRPVL